MRRHRSNSSRRMRRGSRPESEATGRFLPFATQAAADIYIAAHPGAYAVTYETALDESKPTD